MVGTVIAQRRGEQGEDNTGYSIALRPSMSYHHHVGGHMHGNAINALRRDGYPITPRMFEGAY
eukprot:13601804-Alexandrium_andersonii.AAC.1